jgi:predicted helicase
VYSGTVIVDEPERMAKVVDYSKVEYIKNKFAGLKIAIYYKFIAEEMAIRYVFGSENLTNEAIVFNESTNLIFISQIQSGREGVNISTADALIFLNIDFSAVSYWQARARIQTKDRVKEANIHWIFSKGGIEDKIYEAVMNKKDYTTYHFKKDFNI